MNNIEKNKKVYDYCADKYYSEYFNVWEGESFDVEFLNKLTGKKAFLDLGCGNGNLAHFAMQKGFKVKGYDLSEKRIAIGKKYNPKLDIHVMDITNIPKEKEKFDGAIYSYSLMHLTKAQAKQSLLSLNKNLKMGAVLCILTCKGKGFKYIACEDFDKSDKMFFTFYTEESITKLLNSCGYEVQNIKLKYDDSQDANVSSEDLVVFATKVKEKN